MLSGLQCIPSSHNTPPLHSPCRATLVQSGQHRMHSRTRCTNVIMQSCIRNSTLSNDCVACDLSICALCKICCTILNFWPKSYSNPNSYPNANRNPNPSRIVQHICRLCKLTNCMQQLHYQCSLIPLHVVAWACSAMWLI